MEPVERFFWWIEERHRIFRRRNAGISRDDWTKDEILKSYRFTNPFRENDKTTIWFRENMRDPLKNQSEVLMATIIFRWFNLIETGETLLSNNLHVDWKPELARREIKKQQKYITGGYIIKSPNGMDKVDGIIWCIDQMWEQRDNLINELKDSSLHRSWHVVMQFPYQGPFMSYEIITDLRHTYLLNEAKDIYTWANAGPGAMRGLNRIYGRELNYTSRKHDWNQEMFELLKFSPEYLSEGFPKLEMRDIEHSLCEFDKYERVRNGEGAPRGRYP